MSGLLILQASAGSGKTTRLVKEFLVLALSSKTGYKNTLAITFTNKATSELKSRVITYLSGISKGEYPQLAKEIKDELIKKFHKPDNFDIKVAADKVLKLILHDYSNFMISTIDSFCSRIIRSFAKELGLKYGVNIELDTDKVNDVITKKLLDNYSPDNELGHFLEDYLIYKMDDNKSWNIENDIFEITKELFNEEFWTTVFNSSNQDITGKKQIMDFIKEMKELKFTFENYLTTEAEKILELISKEGITYSDFVGGTTGSAMKNLVTFTNGDIKVYKKVKDIFDNKKSFLKIPDNLNIENKINHILNYYYNNIIPYNTANTVLKTIYILGIFADLLKQLDEYRSENKVILGSDINNILRKLISDDVSPFIYEKIGARISNVMIDEFQDTSKFQWNNLKPLIINSLSEKNTSLIVGDTKQSIYRWRNGDMRLLIDGVQNDLNSFSDIIKKDTLNKNYRSCERIVNFNNNFFKKLIDISSDETNPYNNILLKTYESDSLEQIPGKSKSCGYVELNFYPYDAQNKKEGGIGKANSKTLEIVRDLKKDNFLNKDILILTSTNEEATNIASVLAEYGFTVISEQSLLVKNSTKVKLIINILYFLNNNRNILAKKEILFHYLNLIKKTEDFTEVFQSNEELLHKIFTGVMPDKFFLNDEKIYINSILNDLNTYEITEHIINFFEFNKNADPFILGLLNDIFNFSIDSTSDISSYLEYWEENKNKLSISVPDTLDGIRIMTIHKAKGLDGKVVIIPYANWDFDVRGGKENFWAGCREKPFDKIPAFFIKSESATADTYFKADYYLNKILSRIDNINMLYVAFTRAEERLYINVPGRLRQGISEKIIQTINTVPEFQSSFLNEQFTYGVKSKSSLTSTETESPIDINSTIWYKKMFIKSSVNKLKILNNENIKIKIDKGIILHKMLAFIKYPDDLENALNKAVYEGLINSSDKEEFRNLLYNIINNEEIKMFFSKEYKVYNETEILTTTGITCRPDRVITKDSQAIIIDYKTGKERPEFKKQLDEYASLLRQMNYDEVKKYIIFINEYSNNIAVVKEIF